MKELTPDEEAQVLADFKDFAKRSDDHYGKSLDRQIKDLEFENDKMYDKEDDKVVIDQGGALLTFDMTRVPVNGVINQYRKAPHIAKVEARSARAKEKSRLVQGVIRGICRKGGLRNASVVAVDREIKGGVGYVATITKYSSEEDWNQEVYYEGVISPELVGEDPNVKTATAMDADEKFFVGFPRKKAAEEEHGLTFSDDEPCILSDTRWSSPEGCVAEIKYFKRKKVKTKIYLSEDGETIAQDKARKNSKMKSRETTKTTVMCYTIIGNNVVSYTELPLTIIPLTRYAGESVYCDGKVEYQGMRRPSRGVSRLINYIGSGMGEDIAMRPKPTTYAVDESVADYLEEHNSKGWIGVKRYKGFSEDGKQAFGPPIDSNRPSQINDHMQALGTFQNLLTNVLGVQPGGVATDQVMNETATATISRAKSADINNYQFMDNAGEANEVIFKITGQLLNTIYDTEREIPIDDDEDGYRNETLNISEIGFNPNDFEITAEGGPMVSNEESENFNKLLAISNIVGPQIALSFADKLALASGADEADEIAKRLQIVMRQTLGFDVNDDQANQDPQAVKAMEEMTMQMQQVMADKQALQQQFEQAVTYINQLTTQIIDESEKTAMDKYKTDANNANKLQLKVMDMQSKSGSDETKLVDTQMKIVADAEAQRLEAEKELAESLIQAQPDTIIEIQQQTPKYTAIDGMRNDLTFE